MYVVPYSCSEEDFQLRPSRSGTANQSNHKHNTHIIYMYICKGVRG